jgi:hypothetical protein
VFSVIASVLSEKDLSQIFEQLANLSHESPLENIQEPIDMNCKDIIQKCLVRFVQYQRHISEKGIADAIGATNWIRVAKEPSGVRKEIRDFVAGMNRLTSEIVDRLALTRRQDASDPDLAAWRGRGTMLKSAPYSSGTVAPTFVGLRDEGIHQIDRLFMSVNQLHLSRQLDFESQSIVGAILVYSLKSMLEYVRLNCFSSHGFNQMQVDVFFLYTTFKEQINDQQQEIFPGLIEEIISSTADRTIEPIPLDVGLLRRLSSV